MIWFLLILFKCKLEFELNCFNLFDREVVNLDVFYIGFVVFGIFFIYVFILNIENKFKMFFFFFVK